MRVIEKKLQEALAHRPRKHITGVDFKPAAVLLPIYIKRGQVYILFTKRTMEVSEHKGEISFPGGSFDAEDLTLLNTALRECAEEIGLKSGVVQILGALDDTLTETSGYIISPFVALIPSRCKLKLSSGEIEEAIEIPVSVFLDSGNRREETEIINGKVITSYVYYYQGNVIWGATARILSQFLDVFVTVADNH